MAKKKRKQQEQTNKLLIIGGIVVAAVVVVGLLIASNRTPDVDASSAPVIDPSIPRGLTKDGNPYLGEPDAPVTMLLYEDFGCHNCKTFHEDVDARLIEEYIVPGRVKLVIYYIAFVDAASSLPGAEGATCALDQGEFWEYRDLLFENQGVRAFSRENLIQFAETAGLDIAQFSNCFDRKEYTQEIVDRSQVAYDFGITGTPTLEINGERQVGVFPYVGETPNQLSVKALLDIALQEAGE